VTTSRQNQGTHLKGTVHDYRRTANEVLERMVGGNKVAAGLWMKSFNKDLKAVPADLMKTKQGAHDVAAYLERMSGR